MVQSYLRIALVASMMVAAGTPALAAQDGTAREAVTVATVLRDIWRQVSAIFSTRSDGRAEQQLPPSSGGWPNEPAGFAPLVERRFEKLDEGWYVGNSRLSIVSTPAGPHSQGGTGQIRFDAGFSPGGSPSRTATDFDARREVYIAFWIMLSPNYQAANNGAGKILYAANRRSDCRKKSSYFISLTGSPGTTEFPLVAHAQATELHSTRRLNPNLSSLRIRRGEWYLVEQLLTANTPGVRNGEVHVWVNGTKTTEYRDVGWVAENPSCGGLGTWIAVDWSPVWGSRNHQGDIGVLSTHGPFYQWMNHIHVSGR